MKQNAMRNITIIIMFALACAAQATAVDYKGTYKVTRVQPTVGVATTVTAPTVGFQSTSAYSAQWQEEQEEQEEPMLNADGTVNEGAYVGSSPHVRKNGPGGGPGSSPGTPGGQLDPNAQQPLGDVMLPMMMLLCAYAIYKVSRKQAFKTTGKSE